MIELFVILGLVSLFLGTVVGLAGMMGDSGKFCAAGIGLVGLCLFFFAVGAKVEDREQNPQNHFSKNQKALLASQGMGKYVVDQTNGTVRFILTPKDCD